MEFRAPTCPLSGRPLLRLAIILWAIRVAWPVTGELLSRASALGALQALSCLFAASLLSSTEVLSALLAFIY